MDRQTKWDLRFLDLAKLVSGWSKDPSTKVGAVITNGNRFISLGFNGFPKKMIDTEELYSDRDEKYSRIIHGEQNALIESRIDVNGFTLYTYPFMPCDRCFVIMAQAGIQRFVFPKPTEEQLGRWYNAFEKTNRYAVEMGLELAELDY